MADDLKDRLRAAIETALENASQTLPAEEIDAAVDNTANALVFSIGVNGKTSADYDIQAIYNSNGEGFPVILYLTTKVQTF